MLMRNLILLMMLLGIYLSRGCSNLPTNKYGDYVETFQQCAPTFVYVDESKKSIDVGKSHCSVREYKFSLNNLGAVPGSSSKKPLSYCDRCVGFKDYAAAATFWEKVRLKILEESDQ